MALARRRKAILISLLFYWPAIFILTHIPIPQMVREAGVSDKTLHINAYLILVFLLWFSVYPDTKVNWRKAAAWWVVFVVSGYGIADEWLQGLVAGRSPSAIDFLANLAGVVAGLILFSFLTFRLASLVVTGITIFLLANLTRVDLAELLPIANTVFHLLVYALFSLLWTQYMKHLLPLKPPQSKWLIAALALPIGLLFVVELFSVLAGNGLRPSRAIVSSLGTVAVVVTIYLTVLFRRSSTQELPPY